MTNSVRYPRLLFWAFPPGRAYEVEVRYPPHPRVSQRYLRDTTWKQGKIGAIPPLRYYLKKVLCDMGGISHRAAKFLRHCHLLQDGYQPTFFLFFFFGIIQPISVTDFYCLEINSGVTDTDCLPFFPGPMGRWHPFWHSSYRYRLQFSRN